MRADDYSPQGAGIPLRRVFISAMLAWTLVAVVVYVWEIDDNRNYLTANALAITRASFEKDIAFRRWASKHGGVYVPATAETPPNPYLNIPNREITTPSGRLLTLMNPAYMIRQVYEIARSAPDSPQGHITSLNPIRPENAPDSWERKALEYFERGGTELSEYQEVEGIRHFRFMHVLKTEQPCLKCHAAQGYREGDVRGGISVTIPVADLERIMLSSNFNHLMIVATVWALGMAGILFSSRIIGRAERELYNKMDFAENLILNSTTPTFVINSDHQVLIWNRALEELTGILATEVIGTGEQWRAFYPSQRPCLADIVLDDSYRESMDLYSHISRSRLIPDGLSAEGNYSFDGRRCQLVFSAAPIRDRDGRIIAAIETLEDITERISLEAQLLHSQKMESVGELAGGIAHDFNNVLTVINGYADLLQITLEEDDESTFFAKEISASVDRASGMTRSLLAFSGKHEMMPQFDDLNQILANIRKSLGRLIREDIELIIHPVAEHLPIHVDRVQIEQVLINLIVNARDAMESGGAITVSTLLVQCNEVRVEGNAVIPPGQYACLAVADNGTGIDANTLERIFEPFFTTKEHGKGTGLGLAIIQSIIAKHNGYISVTTAPGLGTEFRVYLPLSSGESVHSWRATEVQEIHYHGTETVLLAEDDDEILKMLREVLSRYGYQTLTAADGVEAMELFDARRDEIKIAIVDVIMPRMNGREVVEQIKRERPELPVIMISGYPDEIINLSAIGGVKVNFLHKPVKPLDLLANIRKCLDDRP